jgi:hypothetical protein
MRESIFCVNCVCVRPYGLPDAIELEFAIWKDFCAEFSTYENARTSHNGQLAPEKRVRRRMSLRDIEWLCFQLAINDDYRFPSLRQP